jgi:hypothetical protein
VSQLNDDISVLLFETQGSSKAFNDELDAAESYNCKLIDSKTLLQGKISNYETSQPSAESRTSVSKPTKLKLPELPLPTYSHAKNETLPGFLSAFESIIKHYVLSDYEKFVFLKRQLRGPPLVLVESLSLAQQSYESAVSLLNKAFASDITQKYEVIQRLRNLKCANKPYEFLGSHVNLSRKCASTL